MNRDEALIAAFAAELKAQRSAAKLSQEELAYRAGINRTYIAKLELAQNQPTLTILNSIATALGADLSEFISATLKRYRRELRSKG